MNNLSEGWIIKQLGEVVDINLRPKKDELKDDMLASFIPMKCVEQESGQFHPLEDRRVSDVRKGYTPFKDGDVIFAKVTPCMENGKAAVMNGLTNGIGFGSTEFYSLRPKEVILPQFLFFFIIQRQFRKVAGRNMTGAVGLKRVPKSFIQQQKIPIPPLPEQRRIVAKIEELFSKLDAGVDALKKAKAQLKHYRQSVLAAAVTGELTKDWREAHPNTEPASKLLKRILKQRREQWNGKGKYKEPQLQEIEGLPKIPENWTWTNFQSLAVAEKNALKAGPFGSALKKSFYVRSGYKIYGQEQVINNDPYYGNYYIVSGRKPVLSEKSISKSNTLLLLC